MCGPLSAGAAKGRPTTRRLRPEAAAEHRMRGHEWCLIRFAMEHARRNNRCTPAATDRCCFPGLRMAPRTTCESLCGHCVIGLVMVSGPLVGNQPALGCHTPCNWIPPAMITIGSPPSAGIAHSSRLLGSTAVNMIHLPSGV